MPIRPGEGAGRRTARMPAPESQPTVVDIAFAIEGSSLPADHGWLLRTAIEARLPWLADEALAGIHPLRGAATNYGVLLLAQRAKLTLRLPEARVPDCQPLQDSPLDVGGAMLRIGAGKPRALQSSATLSALRVASLAFGVAAFEADVAGWLQQLEIECGVIAGRRQVMRAGSREIAGFALALHGLRPADSLRIQRNGLGGDRRAGWGIFVPAKTIADADA